MDTTSMKHVITKALKKVLANHKVLEYYDITGLVNQEPVTLYHGTTKLFKKFDLSKSRDELVNKFYGKGIFLTPSKQIASRYANANRNIGFEPSIIDDLAKTNSKAATFLKDLYEQGGDVWDKYNEIHSLEEKLGADPNTLSDICGYIIGSKKKPLGFENDPINIFDQSTGLPDWVYNALDQVGIDSYKYRPKIYTVEVKVDNTLVTDSKTKAKTAPQNGYDCVVYYGEDLVNNTPEVAIYDPSKISIKKIELD